MTKWMWCVALAGAAGVFCGCGGGESSDETVDEEQYTAGDERREEPDDGLQIEGLMGSLSSDEVARGLEPRMGRFAQCFANRYDDIEYVGGRIQFSFRVDTSGAVKWVWPKASTVGDRETERCLVEVAAGTRFARPRGGEAEFDWPLAFDPPEDVRPPFDWEEDRVADVVAEHGPNVMSECGARGSFIVTAYVAPGGEVLTAGASTTEQAAADYLDCISETIGEWRLADPGSYPAKVTFALQ